MVAGQAANRAGLAGVADEGVANSAGAAARRTKWRCALVAGRIALQAAGIGEVNFVAAALLVAGCQREGVRAQL